MGHTTRTGICAHHNPVHPIPFTLLASLRVGLQAFPRALPPGLCPLDLVLGTQPSQEALLH